MAAGAVPRVCVADPAGVCEDSAETALSLSSPVPLSTWPGTPVHGRTRERLETPAGQGGLVPKASPSAEPGAGPLLAGAGSAPGAQLTDDPAGQARGPCSVMWGCRGEAGVSAPLSAPAPLLSCRVTRYCTTWLLVFPFRSLRSARHVAHSQPGAASGWPGGLGRGRPEHGLSRSAPPGPCSQRLCVRPPRSASRGLSEGERDSGAHVATVDGSRPPRCPSRCGPALSS